MRNAHRPKSLPNRKLPRGIERQDELIELIERRFHQEDLIRNALRQANESTTLEQSYKNETTSAEESTPATSEALSPKESVPADTDDITTAESVPADAGDTTTAESASADTNDTAKDTDSPDSVTIRWHGKNETITDPLVWLTVFDTVREAGDAVTREVAARRFHGESYWKTCDALYLSTGTYYHHVRAILHYAFACAVYHRLIDPRPKLCHPKAK